MTDRQHQPLFLHEDTEAQVDKGALLRVRGLQGTPSELEPRMA